MPKNPANSPDQRTPISEQFGKFEKNYGGDAVNAHDDRMDTILHENAKQLGENLDTNNEETR